VAAGRFWPGRLVLIDYPAGGAGGQLMLLVILGAVLRHSHKMSLPRVAARLRPGYGQALQSLPAKPPRPKSR
jgi:hypothetical protein